MKEANKTYCDIAKLCVRPINKSVAKSVIVNNHYSKTWTKVSYALGLFYTDNSSHKFFDGTNETLVGVACYGDPIGRLCGTSISDKLGREEVLELTRLFVFDGYGSNIESWFVGQTFKWLKQNAPHIKALISYSDPKAGHVGTVYQATNWIYQGNRIRPNDSWQFRWTEDGEWQHPRSAYVKYKTCEPGKIQKLTLTPFWIKRELRKYRYVYFLKDRKELVKNIKHPSLPYPKVAEQFQEEIHKLEPIETAGQSIL